MRNSPNGGSLGIVQVLSKTMTFELLGIPQTVPFGGFSFFSQAFPHLTVLRIIKYPPPMLIRIREFNVERSDARTVLIRGLIDT